MNMGVQRKFADKKLIVTVNIIDPFLQKNKTYTYGPNFVMKSFNTTRTRNFRLNVGYNFTKTGKKITKAPRK
jgi:hypothetical protein